MGSSSSKTPHYTKPAAVATKWFPDFVDTLSAIPASFCLVSQWMVVAIKEPGPLIPRPELSGKVIAVTGCTSGTGFVAAKTCAQKGAHVVLLNRKSSRADEAEAAIKATAKDEVTAVECDLQSFASVEAASKTLLEKFGSSGIDVLCNNAGVMALEDKATADKYDVQMQTNHLSHFMLTAQCVPLLEKAASLRGEARVVNHSSLARKLPRQKLDAKYFGPNGGDLGGNGASMFFGGARWVRYHMTKLANAVFTLALADKFKDGKIKAVCAAPGLAATNLQVTTHADGGMAETWVMRWSQSAEDGTMPLLQCCVGAGVENGDLWEPRNGYYGPAAKVAFEPICTDAASRAMLWQTSEEACGPFPALAASSSE